VNESVTLAKRLKNREAAGFVNALLRRIIREQGMAGCLIDRRSPQEILSVEASFPLWAVRRLWDRWGGDETKAFCWASNQIAPLTLRVNTLKLDRDQLMDRLCREGLAVSPTSHSPHGIVLENPPPVSEIPLLESGYYQIQDEASQLIALLVNPQPGETVLDACAAPGAKTTHLGQLMANRGRIIALDIDEAKLRRLRESGRRMGVTNVTVLRRDARRPPSLIDGKPFDAILLDLPCTGWGTIRRNPDIKWRTGPGDPIRLASLQRSILDNMAGFLREGGRLVYSTCTVYEEENENVIEGFLAQHKAYSLDHWRPHLFHDELFDHRGFLRTSPHHHGIDGFFAARLTRS
jgi:16S rRNA (cytosine967-C5)-methyltransferase